VEDRQPSWSPDGEFIAFVSEGRTGQTNSDIYRMDTNPATDDPPVNLTPNDFTTNPVYQYNDVDPSWSPDGTHITYSTVGDVWTMTSAGAEKENLTDGEGGGRYPAWSPNGNSIVYTRSGDIYVMDAADGGNKTAVDTTARQDITPDWQPDPPTCDVTGDGDADTLTGTPADETICGLGGNDSINGGGGDDIIMGGAGNDTLVASSDRTTMNGGTGSDTASFAGSTTSIEASLPTGFARRAGTSPIEGAALVGIENMTGSSLGDELTGSNTANKLIGGAGRDELIGLGGKDRINSRDGAKNDTVHGGSGTDRCTTDKREVSIKSC
jgi:Ca2+-binding RTX toxin-like protein